MPDVLAFLLLMFFLLSIGLSISVASFAFSEPQAFSRWAPIVSWLLSLKAASNRFRKSVSFTIGSIFLLLTIALSFLFGSLVTTFTFEIWNSPLMRLLTGD